MDYRDYPGPYNADDVKDQIRSLRTHLMEIKNKRITIIGGKRSGVALARLVVGLGGQAKISELDTESSLIPEFRRWANDHNVDLEFNGHTQAFIEGSDLVVLSPGVRFDALPVQWARAKDIPVLGEIEFTSQFCNKPIIAITGSNGKTTVSTLIRDVIEASGNKACLCGNVGAPFASFIPNLDNVDYVVLEVSSFQLESIVDPKRHLDIHGFKPRIAVLLNLSQNHLDRHRDMEEYVQAKIRLFINQDANDYAVLNDRDSIVKELTKNINSRRIYFNADGTTQNPNHAAVMAVAEILGIDSNCCGNVFRSFKGVEHRMEKAGSVDGIDFINDSKATTTQAALWALKRIDQPIIMICGGRDKNLDFSILKEIVKSKVRKMYVIGEAKEKMRRTFEQVVNLEECTTLDEALQKARQNASAGDCVLFSPMCASFDMFTDYEERGRIFKDLVKQLTSYA